MQRLLIPDPFELLKRRLRALIFFEHPLHVLHRDMIVISEAAPEVFRDMHQFVDDRFRLDSIAEAIEPLGYELQNIEGFDPHGGLQDLAHSVTTGDDPSRRRAEASDAYDLVQIDVIEVQCSNDIHEPVLDVVRDLVPDVP
jgi:hypothetical protein